MKSLLYAVSERLYHVMLRKGVLNPGSVRSMIQCMQGGTVRQTEEAVESYYVRMISTVLVSAFITAILTGVTICTQSEGVVDVIHVVRQDYGGDSEVLSLFYEDVESGTQEMTFEVEARQYRPEELETAFVQGFHYLEKGMLGENAGLEEVNKNLILADEIPGSGIEVRWHSSNRELLSNTGEVHNEELLQQELVVLELELRYDEETEEREYKVMILPARLTEAERERIRVKRYIEEQLREKVYVQEFDLDLTQQGTKLYGDRTSSQDWIYVLVLCGLVTCLLAFLGKSRLKEQMKWRQQQLRKDYSYFVNQLLLYMSAGATIPGALERVIVSCEQLGKTDQPLYQELQRVKQEIHMGITKEQALLEFGRRTGVLSYIKLVSLLTQQMKKGGDDVAVQLEEEEHAAFERRKDYAKKAGEEAGTKLLLPMILLMIISMILVMYPALASFDLGI